MTPEYVQGKFSSSPHQYLDTPPLVPLKLWIGFVDGSKEAYEVPSRDINKTLHEYRRYGVRRLIEVT